MAEGREDSEWNRTASLLCQQAEMNRDKAVRARPHNPLEFHAPHLARLEAKHKAKPMKAPISALQMFLPKNKRAKRHEKKESDGK